ncbi:MAG TPA: hypothetical protein VKB88_33310, partial [Bryobacteraceae bacterium]|nr:hypothetical protein [Bryobacteraceae bacterium]
SKQYSIKAFELRDHASGPEKFNIDYTYHRNVTRARAASTRMRRIICARGVRPAGRCDPDRAKFGIDLLCEPHQRGFIAAPPSPQ